MVLIPIFVAAVAFLVWHDEQCNESLAALSAECEAGKAFVEWRLRNQGVYIGLSEEGRLLLSRWLDAYDWFLHTHTFIDGAAHREWIVKMFYDLPPKHPDDIKKTGTGPVFRLST